MYFKSSEVFKPVITRNWILMSYGNNRAATFCNSLIKENNQDKLSPTIFATSQCTLLTLWYSTNSPRSARNFDNVTDEYIPIVTLDLEFEIQGIEFSPDSSCLVITGSSPLILIWRADISGDNMINIFQSKSLLSLFQNNQFNAYNSELSHPHINVYDLIELPEFQDLYFCDLRELIKVDPDLALIPPSANFNFARLCMKQDLVLFVGGPGNFGIYQISLLSTHPLTLMDVGISQEISCIGASCDNSLFAIVSIENELILINPASGSRAMFSLAQDSTKTTFDPISHILFSNFEPDQFAVTFHSGYLILYNIFLPDQDVSPNTQISIVLTSSPCSASWQKSPTSAPIAFSPLNRYLLASITPDCKLATYDIVKRREVGKISLSSYPTSIVFGTNGTTVMIGSEQGTLELYDLLRQNKPTCILQSSLDSTKSHIEIIAFQKPLLKKHAVLNFGGFHGPGLSSNSKAHSNNLDDLRERRKKDLRSNRSSFVHEPDDKQTNSYDIRSHHDLSDQLRHSIVLESPSASSFNNFKDLPQAKDSSPNNGVLSNLNIPTSLRRGSSHLSISSFNSPRERSFTLPSQKRVDVLLTHSNTAKDVNTSRSSRVRSLSSTDSQKEKALSLINSGKTSSSKSSSLNSPSDSVLNLAYGKFPENLDSNTVSKNDLAKLIDNIVEDKTHRLRANIKNDIDSSYTELLSQFRELKVSVEKMTRDSARVPELLKYIQVLEEENRRLKLDY